MHAIYRNIKNHIEYNSNYLGYFACHLMSNSIISDRKNTELEFFLANEIFLFLSQNSWENTTSFRSQRWRSLGLSPGTFFYHIGAHVQKL